MLLKQCLSHFNHLCGFSLTFSSIVASMRTLFGLTAMSNYPINITMRVGNFQFEKRKSKEEKKT